MAPPRDAAGFTQRDDAREADFGCDLVKGVNNDEETFRRLAIRDDAFVDFLLGDEGENLAASMLDAKTHALVRLGAFVAIDIKPNVVQIAVNGVRRQTRQRRSGTVDASSRPAPAVHVRRRCQ